MKQLLFCLAFLFTLNHITAQMKGDQFISNAQTAKIALESNPPIELQIMLNGIFMGECGNPNDCHHEPVAGVVMGTLQDVRQNQIPNTAGNATFWNSEGYSLVCNNYPYEPATYSNGDQVDLSRIAQNIQKSLFYSIDAQSLINRQYEFVVSFNLGNRHQDNPFAGIGDHWLRRGDDLITMRVNLKDYYNSKSLLIGPYETSSDRCHEYFLQFTMVGQ